jgi:NAD(P)-dependent dehydrogenase (short-subunit alcohol dehydrogenase family)
MGLPMPDLTQLYGLDGRTALITGPTKGIGLETARLFHAAGAKLVLADVDGSACKSLAAELDALAVPTDVRDPDALVKLAEKAGPVDVLVCNAGIPGPVAPMHEVSDDQRLDLFATNMEHPLKLSGFIAPAMAQRGKGSIILLSSIAGLRGNARLGLYGMTKAALAQLARNLAVEWGPSGVRANAIAPGLIETEWAKAILTDPTAAERRLGMTPLRRAGMPKEIAATALFLASDAAGFITGQTIVADGGTTISDGN